MKANVLFLLLIGVILVIVASVVFVNVQNAGPSKVVNLPPVGMGDLHRFENDGFIPGTYIQEAPKAYYGMGDLQRLEFLQETQFPE